MSGTDVRQLVAEFTDAMTTDDVETVVHLFNDDPTVEWVMMATGESFQGRDAIRQLAQRSKAARSHTDELGIKPTCVFTNAEGTQLCWEYVHDGIVTDNWPSSSAHRPAPGTKFELPIVLVCDVRDGKLQKLREYFDLNTLLEAGRRQRLYA